jgi:hypothetical protein
MWSGGQALHRARLCPILSPMKTRADIEQELERLVVQHYYSEDYELEWAAKSFFDGLSQAEQELFEGVMIERLSGQPGLVEITLATRLHLPSLTPFLVSLLDQETSSSSTSRALIAALARNADVQAYAAVERFLDSEQEGEALACLARMDFHRTLPYLRRAVQQEHLHNFCLHAMHDFMVQAGIEALREALQKMVEPEGAALARHVRKILTSKAGAFNPFTEEELKRLV